MGCVEASFTILETINHMLERGSKIFGCFLDVRKAIDTVWIDGLFFKLFTELGIKGRMWLAIKDLYTGVKAQVPYSGSLSRSFDVSQGTGQGRIGWVESIDLWIVDRGSWIVDRGSWIVDHGYCLTLLFEGL